MLLAAELAKVELRARLSLKARLSTSTAAVSAPERVAPVPYR